MNNNVDDGNSYDANTLKDERLNCKKEDEKQQWPFIPVVENYNKDLCSIFGSILGSVLGLTLGSLLGSLIGSILGSKLGSILGSKLGSIFGSIFGSILGSILV